MDKKSIVLVVILLFISLFGIRALFHPGYYTSHDGWHQVARLYHFDQAIRDGHIPPYWAGGLLQGAGYPLFVFNYHMPWYIAEAFVLFGLSIFDAIKLTFVLGYVLSGLFMFLWVRNMWGDKGGFMAAFLYLWAPYRFSNIFVRASLGEATGFIFLPLFFWSIASLTKREDKRMIVIGSLGLAGLLLSHVMIVFLLVVPTSIFILSLLLQSKKRTIYFLRMLTVMILGLSLSAYYLFPAIAYRDITVFREIMRGLYEGHFVTLKRLIYSPWGYGFSNLGPDALSVQVGIAQWLAVGLALVVLLLELLKRAKKNRPSRLHFRSLLFPFGLAASFGFSIVMMIRLSGPIWRLVDNWLIVDFPWRFLLLSLFFASILAGWLVSFVEKRWLQLPLMITLIAVALYTNRNHLRVNQYTDLPLDLYIVSEQTSNTHDEYAPKWADRKYLKEEKRPLVIPETSVPLTEMEVIISTTTRKEFSYTASQSGELSVNLLSFPGWEAFIDGGKTDTSYDRYGLVRLWVPEDKHHVSLVYVDTPVMRLGKLASLLAVVSVLVLLFV